MFWAEATGATSYELYWGTSSGVTTGSNFAGETSSLVFDHTGVLAGYQYCYRVRSKNEWGTSELSTESCVTVNGSAPPPPSSLSLGYWPMQQGIYLGWSPSAGATSYIVYWRVGPGVTTDSQTLTPTTTTDYLHTGVVSGYEYCYRVAGANAYGTGALSQEQCLTVP